jgi:hypothetical protein
VNDKRITLKPTLFYGDMTEVNKQDILIIANDSRLLIENGSAFIRFRISEVSKNHQRQSFVLKVCVDKSNSELLDYDVMPVDTIAIEVRSKRKKFLNNSTIKSETDDMPANKSAKLDHHNFKSLDNSYPFSINIHQVMPAFSTVVEWINNSLKALKKIRWEDLDNNNANFLITNPNKFVDDLFDEYSGKVRSSINTVITELGSISNSCNIESYTEFKNVHLMDNENMNINDLSFYQNSYATESNISYLISESYFSSIKNVYLGLPVFDSSKKLLGFYLETENENISIKRVVIEFNSLGPINSVLTSEQICKLEYTLELMIEKRSSNLYSLATDTFESLTAMKEEAFINFWSIENKFKKFNGKDWVFVDDDFFDNFYCNIESNSNNIHIDELLNHDDHLYLIKDDERMLDWAL